MTWLELREKVLAKIWDMFFSSLLLCGASILITTAVTFPIYMLKMLIRSICN